MNFLWTVFEGRQIITFSCLGTLLEFFHFPLRMMTHPLAVVHNEDIHPRWVFQPRQQLWCEQEILSAVLLTGSSDEKLEDSFLVGGIHPLVDLVHTPEGDGGQLLQREHVKGCRHASFTARLWKVIVVILSFCKIVWILMIFQNPVLIPDDEQWAFAAVPCLCTSPGCQRHNSRNRFHIFLYEEAPTTKTSVNMGACRHMMMIVT